MPVVSAEITDDRIIDGIRRIEERYVDDKGRVCYCSRVVGKDDKENDIRSMIDMRKTVIESKFAELDAIPAPSQEQPDVHIGQGVPSTQLAEEIKYYLDETSGDLYAREAGGSW